jgi:transposase-like protein
LRATLSPGVWLNFRFRLGYRDIQEMMPEGTVETFA